MFFEPHREMWGISTPSSPQDILETAGIILVTYVQYIIVSILLYIAYSNDMLSEKGLGNEIGDF